MNTPQGFPNPPFPNNPPSGASAGLGPSNPYGAPVAGPPTSPFGSSPTPSWMPQDTPTPPSNRGRNAALGVMALVAIGGAAAVFLLVSGGDESSSSVAPGSTVTIATAPPSLASVVTVTVPTITEPPAEVPTTVPAVVVPATTVAIVETPNLFTGTQAAAVITEIGVARGAAPLRLLQAVIYPGYAFAQVQDPSIPANVDEYQWRGTLGSPAPVTLTGDGDLEANLFSDTEVNWAAIPTLVATALAQIPIEGAEVTHVFVQRNLPFTDTVQIRVFVNGTRGSGFLDADAQGNVIAVNQG